MKPDMPGHGEADRHQVMNALEELGDHAQDLYLEHDLDALTLGTGDGALLRTITLPCPTVFLSPTDRYKYHGLRFYAILPAHERALFYRAVRDNYEGTTFKLKAQHGMINVNQSTMLPTCIETERRDVQPTRIIKNILNSPHNFRIDISPVELTDRVNNIRPLKNNDAILLEWRRKDIHLTGLEKHLDEDSRMVINPHTIALRGLCRKKLTFPGHIAINMQKRNAVKVDGERLTQALAWLGEDKALVIHVSHDPPAIVLRRNDPIARHALLMMQRFLPEEVEYLDRSAQK